MGTHRSRGAAGVRGIRGYRWTHSSSGQWVAGTSWRSAPGDWSYLTATSASLGLAEAYCCDTVLRVGVRYVDGDASSATTFSPSFDTLTPPKPTGTSIEPWVDGRMRFRWTAAAQTDPTPDDPLDLTWDGRYGVIYQRESGARAGFIQAATVGTTAVVQWRFSNMAVVGLGEWNAGGGVAIPDRWLTTWGGEVTAKMPAKATYTVATTITGQATQRPLVCSGANCWSTPQPSPNRRIALQARHDSASSWYGVTTTQTTRAGTFSFAVRPPEPGSTARCCSANHTPATRRPSAGPPLPGAPSSPTTACYRPVSSTPPRPMARR